MSETTCSESETDWLLAFAYSAGVAFTEHHHGMSAGLSVATWLVLGIVVGLGLWAWRAIKRLVRRKAGIA